MVQGTNLGFEEIDGVYVIRKMNVLSQEVTERKVTGRVVDINNQALPGVTVMIAGTRIGVTTDGEGKYSIICPQIKSTALVFSFVGMKKVGVAIGINEDINVVLEEDWAEIAEVVVIGIYERKKESFIDYNLSYSGK